MSELRKKMFWSLFAMLCVLAVTLTFFMDYREYMNTRSEIQEELTTTFNFLERLYRTGVAVSDSEESDSVEEGESQFPQSAQFFMSSPVFEVVIGRKSQIQSVLYYDATTEEVMEVYDLAGQILKSESPGRMEIGNLFTSKYAWYYSSMDTVLVVNITSFASGLKARIGVSLCILAVFCFLFWIISRRITSWMLEPIEKTFEKQRQFIADASHELKTPLAVIIANAEAMERDPNPKWLRNIDSEAGRMNKLITDLLDLTRSEQSKPHMSKVNLSFLTEKECLIQEAVLFEKGIDLFRDIQEGVEVEGAPDQLLQVVTILLDNAIRHAKGWIKVELSQKGHNVVLAVSNNGEPIPEGDREKIFERFYRSDQSRNRSENRYGLGLAIAKNIVESHGGTISVQSSPLQTTFTVHLRGL